MIDRGKYAFKKGQSTFFLDERFASGNCSQVNLDFGAPVKAWQGKDAMQCFERR